MVHPVMQEGIAVTGVAPLAMEVQAMQVQVLHPPRPMWTMRKTDPWVE